MIRVGIIGTGNLARHLFRGIGATSTARVVQVAGRDPAGLSYFENNVATTDLDTLTAQVDLYLLAVSDDAIPTVSTNVNLQGKLVAHCSGTVPLEALAAGTRRAVFYPLQTFSRERELSFRTIPIFIETESSEDLELLRSLAGLLSDTVMPLSSPKRREVHLAAVFANNFTNYLYGIAWEIAADAGIEPTLLLPLIRETAEKIKEIPPERAQTGPAKRGDHRTMDTHLTLLKKEHHRDIYRILSQAIYTAYAKKL